MILEYRSISQMCEALLHNLHKLPHDIGLIVGIPRSGMLPANILALYLNIPYTDIDSFIEGRFYSVGERGAFIKKDSQNKVLIMDDSIQDGTALNNAKKKLESIRKLGCYQLLYGVVYATSWTIDKVDFYCEIIDENRIFQWNIFHHKKFISNAFFDIDGVLCPNPPVDDDGPLYLDYISNAPILYRPSVQIDTLVTCRLEKYREVTEKWLADNGIMYKRLIMLDLPNKESRIRWGKHGIFKGELYRDSNCNFFVESSLHEARLIVKTARKPVFCIESFSMLNDETLLLKRDLKTQIKGFPLVNFLIRVKNIVFDK